MKNGYARSDLACESVAREGMQIEGTEYKERRVGEFLHSALRVKSETAANRLGKEVGVYVTISCGRIDGMSEENTRLLERLLAGEVRGMAARLTGKAVDENFCVLIAGLGNAALTADAIGPKTAMRLTATRHLREHDVKVFRSVGCAAVAALAPGVLGQTGIETAELLRGAVACVHPDVVIAVDALAARSCDRLATTVQLCDTGIAPGSGVGNHRTAINRETLGVPVIALGVPTVVDSSTLVYDALRKSGIEEIGEELREVLENGKRFFVSLKESDLICESVSSILSRALGIAFAEALVTNN